MKVILGLIFVVCVLIGCGAPADEPVSQPKRDMPGGVGLTAGQTGTGTTSGASTGY